MEVTRHFTATVMIVFKDRLLLHMHKKLNKWLPPGGHIERDELPDKAAIREVKEETGIDVKLFSESKLNKFEVVEELVRPQHMLLEDINPYHQHIDFIYYAEVKSDSFDIHSEEGKTLRWFTLEEIKNTKKMPDDVIFLAEKAISFFK